jgi:regulator of protease activity HflC (stomatin/prohibitin superfamily)
MINLVPTIVILAFGLFILSRSVRILREYERGVVFVLGRFWKVKGPGLVLLLPVVQQMVKVGLRTVVMDVPSQDVISKDNVSVKVSAVVYFRVIDPKLAIIAVEDYLNAINQLSQTTLRSVLGQHDLDEMLSARNQLNTDIQTILDEHTDAWGIKVSNVEIKRVDLDERMSRAMARQAEAERERRAKVIYADGELQASGKFLEAARILSALPEAMQLRYLQTLSQISSDRTTTIVFPFPLDMFREFQNKKGTGNQTGTTPAP